jgi:ABC-type lipoprotein export system ATPase subunit
VTHEQDVARRAHRVVTIHDGAISGDMPAAPAAEVAAPR